MTIVHIAVLGNPVDGLTFHGPFFDIDEASDWAGNNSDEWWIAELQSAKPDNAYPPFVVIDAGLHLDDPVVVGPFANEEAATQWAASGNDRQVTQLWTPDEHAKAEERS